MTDSNKKENQRVRLTKTMFKNALIQLLSEKKIYEITIQELCVKAELNRTTFYKHYQNVRDVLDEIEAEVLKQSKQCLEQIDISKESTIIMSINCFLCYVKENAGTYRLLLNPYNDFSNKLLSPALILLNDATEKLPNYNAENKTYLYEYILSGSMTLIRNWLFSNTVEPPEVIAKQVYEMAVKLMK